jgi:hypothetical protein
VDVFHQARQRHLEGIGKLADRHGKLRVLGWIVPVSAALLIGVTALPRVHTAVAVAIFYTVVGGTLFGLASSQPKFAAWVSQGAHAESASSVPAAAPEAIQVAAKRLGLR